MYFWIVSTLSVLLTATPSSTAPTGQSSPSTETSKLTKEALLARLARLPGLQAKFREEKRMALLVAPLVTEGTLHFVPPGKLVRHTIRPSRSSVLIVGDQLSFGDAHGQEAIDLGKNPTVRLFVDSFLRILAGDGPALMRMYELQFTAGTGTTWTLVMRPKQAPMNALIDRLTIRGDDVVVHEMEMIEVGGDVTSTRFTDVDTNRKYSKAEQRRIFRLKR